MVYAALSNAASADWYKPHLDTRANIQLQGTINQSYPVDMYDIDLFDTPAETIQALKATGAHVICYFSAGSYENWRADAKQFAKKDLGKNLSGWPGERWLDIRSSNVRKIMKTRMDLAVSKGCEGVDPDNVDGYTNKTGLPLTATHQLSYNRFLATEAHRRNLSIGLKNDLNQIKTLVKVFDFSINEQCHQYHECQLLNPFVAAGKPVFNLEYQQRYVNDPAARQALCLDAATRNQRTLIVPHLLDGSFRIACDAER
jgi:hypothetical protein